MPDKYIVVVGADGAAAHKIKDCLNDGGDVTDTISSSARLLLSIDD